MKSSTRSRVVKSYQVQVSGPRLVDRATDIFESLTPHLTVLTANEEVEGPEELLQSRIGSVRPVEVAASATVDPQPSSILEESAASARNHAVDGFATGHYRQAAGIIAVAEEQAREIVRQAEQEALAIVERANAEVHSYREEIRAEVRAEVMPQARAEGYEAGRQQALADAQKEMDEVRRLLTLAQRAVQEEFRKVDEPLVRLAVKISERILRASLAFDPQLLLNIVHSLPLLPQERGEWSLHISPQDAAWLAGLPADQQPPCPVVKDETLAAGDCYLECAEGIFDARLQSQLARVEQILVEELHGGRLD